MVVVHEFLLDSINGWLTVLSLVKNKTNSIHKNNLISSSIASSFHQSSSVGGKMEETKRLLKLDQRGAKLMNPRNTWGHTVTCVLSSSDYEF